MTDHSLATAVPSASSKASALTGLLWQSLRAQWIFFVIPVFYMLTNAWLLSDTSGHLTASAQALLLGMLTFTILPGIITVFLFRFVQYAVILKPVSPFRQMAADIAAFFRKPSALLLGLPLFLAMLMFNKSMAELKPMIPTINPFSWDQTFMQLDRTLHFGFDPWRILHPLMGFDVVTFVVNNCYNFWFLALFGCFMWFGFSPRSTVNRTQFFLAYMLTWWIGGGLIAVFFSSAGPAYYGGIGLTPDPYAPLMTYLNDVDSRMTLWALDAQQLLWDGYTGKVLAIGISAFPSMHNASTVLFTLASWQRSRKLGICFAIYNAIILFGSMHLGWHYAVDGYAGLTLGLVAWWVAGFAARWHHRRAATEKLNESLAAV
jgi:PAP2 superfamily